MRQKIGYRKDFKIFGNGMRQFRQLISYFHTLSQLQNLFCYPKGFYAFRENKKCFPFG